MTEALTFLRRATARHGPWIHKILGGALMLLALGLLSLGAHRVLAATTRRWFERDVELRANLAVTSARRGLQRHWTSQDATLLATLEDITRDERILGAAACTVDGERLAATEQFPQPLSCGALAERLRTSTGEGGDRWSATMDLHRGTIHLYAVAISPGGFVVLAHDLSFLARREQTTGRMALAAFVLLALAASLLTTIASRLAWLGWNSQLRLALVGPTPREFEPLVRDLRALVGDLARDRVGVEDSATVWSPERLREVLRTHLEGERVILVANREPYIHEHTPEGVRVLHPASGLVTALEPVLRACSGVWIANGSGSADRETSDPQGRIRVPPGEESFSLRRLWLSAEEETGFYYGLSNEGLWPLCHAADTRPQFRQEDWVQYVAVNQKFADAVCSEIEREDAIVLVQDYHFALCPKMIRARLPRATILTFWHIPWPSAERFGIAPWREEILDGLLGSSIMGFHTRQHCNNFVDSVDAFLEARIDRESSAVVQRGQRTLVRPYPISIEWPVHRLDGVPAAPLCRRQVFEELGLAQGSLLGVGIDRLDYTKGIEERLSAVDQLLERHPEFRGRFTFAQLAAPSRTRIERYRALNDRIEDLVQSINDRWERSGWRPIVLLRRHHEPPEVFRYLRAADLCYVSSLHDGMNLVAKEFVAARDDERGVLVLSQFTGASRELTEALIVNPYDLPQASAALARALVMPVVEQRDRLRSMRALVADRNVYRWAGRMLVEAAQLQKRGRLLGRLSEAGGG
ncbi:MAG: trehalose-6-phosphate synthase [Deltaproteobacteria bacterium]|nr:trehalose-6-phosphate synthase [Deltaproteobacteria bacterium]